MAEQRSGRRVSDRSDGAQASSEQYPTTKMTVLTSVNQKPATKRFTTSGVEGYAHEKFWRWRELRIGNFDDLARVLNQIEREPESMIVQGIVARGWREIA